MGLLEQQNDSLLPVTANPKMLAQALKARQQPRKQLDGQGLLDTAAIGLSPIPGVGDVLGLAADASRYINDPSSRTPMNFGLTALGMLPFVPPAAAIFAGPLAKTAKLDQKTLAEGMEKAGRSRDDIWKETGWFKGPEGKWKFEIDDSGMKGVVPLNKWIGKNEAGVYQAPTVSNAWDEAARSLTPEAPVRVKRLFEHQDLKNAYPYGFTKTDQHQDILGMPVHIDEGKLGGAFTGDSIVLGGGLYPKDARSTTLHELQHVVQDREGFARGGNEGMFRVIAPDTPLNDLQEQLNQLSRKQWTPDVGKATEEINRKMSELMKDPYQSYLRLAGEAEARAVQSRMNMNPQQRQATPPWQSYDVPWEQLIIK